MPRDNGHCLQEEETGATVRFVPTQASCHARDARAHRQGDRGSIVLDWMELTQTLANPNAAVGDADYSLPDFVTCALTIAPVRDLACSSTLRINSYRTYLTGAASFGFGVKQRHHIDYKVVQLAASVDLG